ncbi:hypothetical protein F4803DRAFT_556640 [Xylaria telfairii]|nr:hypothetical protein F4803DRAFT_556640 [Xylaria telfairii]
MKWTILLDQIDKHLSVRLEHTLDPEEINKWMFDSNFKRSELYVTTLQILRIFNEYILKQFQKQAQENLLGRILLKTEEVKSLRDGLFNATSLREANLSSRLAELSSRQTELSLREAHRSVVMGRYVLIFTVVTILYLPPSFISTVLDMDIFKKDIAQTRWEYKVSVVSVSLLTYLLSFAAIIAVDWKGFKRMLWASWIRMTSESFRWAFTATFVALIPAGWDYIKSTCCQCWERLASLFFTASVEWEGFKWGLKATLVAVIPAGWDYIKATLLLRWKPGSDGRNESEGDTGKTNTGFTPEQLELSDRNMIRPGVREGDLERGV